ncbi:hypothetical protein [Streptomyces sp. NPDC058307]|uniref:hypothetical protein n=1 Tax=Streptomyces sp. NPDC058307 TaxID=3346439 RepID=UPI0036ECB3CA
MTVTPSLAAARATETDWAALAAELDERPSPVCVRHQAMLVGRPSAARRSV